MSAAVLECLIEAAAWEAFMVWPKERRLSLAQRIAVLRFLSARGHSLWILP